MFLDKVNLENVSNKILYFLSQKSSSFKYCLTILMLSLVVSIWLFGFARPLHLAVGVNRAKLKQLNILKNTCSQSYGHCAELTQTIEDLNAKIGKKLNIIGNSSAYLSLGRVIECINCNGVTLMSYSPGKVEKLGPSDGVYAGKKVSFELVLEGTFLNMFNFFKCLSAIKYCLKYNQLFISKNEQGLIGCKLILDILQVSK